jgi:hypothetical protein
VYDIVAHCVLRLICGFDVRSVSRGP